VPAPSDLRGLPLLGSKEEAFFAYDEKQLNIHDRIRLANPDYGRQTARGKATEKIIVTTVGRVMFNEIWPKELGYHNQPVKKSDLSDLIWQCYKFAGPVKTVTLLDKLKEVGFQAATQAGISIGIDDMLVPTEKENIIAAARIKITEVEKSFREGRKTEIERRLEVKKHGRSVPTRFQKP